MDSRVSKGFTEVTATLAPGVADLTDGPAARNEHTHGHPGARVRADTGTALVKTRAGLTSSLAFIHDWTESVRPTNASATVRVLVAQFSTAATEGGEHASHRTFYVFTVS